MLSIIIPVYNSEQYLPKIFESITNQTNKNFEVIFVDDYSSDNSLILIENFAKESKNIFTYCNNANHGVSYSRNVGLNNAKGDIICFVDSDDYISDNFVDIIISNFHSSDCLIFSRHVIRNNNLTPETVPIVGIYETKLIKQDFKLYSSISNIQFVTNRAFKSKIIQDNDMRFNTNIESGEDLDFNLRYFEQCNNIKYIDEKIYYYNRDNNNSITRTTLHKLPQIIHYNNANFLKFIDLNNERVLNGYKDYNYDLYCYCINMINRNSELSKEQKDKLLALNDDLNYRKYYEHKRKS